jgi:beta-N-acetylhexosaminidase
MQVAALGRAVLERDGRGGVVGVVKHMPGHGRSLGDSHKERPVVEAGDDELEIDIEPFRTLSDAPMGMICHLVYTAWDAGCPASLSPVVTEEIVRGRIGFDGLLMSDDLGMHAMTGSFASRSSGSLAAGSDVAMHCSGDMAEMVDFAAGVRPMTARALERLERAMASVVGADQGASYEELAARRDALIALA